MKTFRFLIILSVACIILCPGLLFAAGSDEASAPPMQPDSQTAEETNVQGLQSGPQVVEDDLISPETADKADDYSDYLESEDIQPVISDPLEPINRAFFVFNDKLYFWFLKPVARGYKTVAPEPVRVGVRNFFSNLGFPIRFVNCLLQAKFTGAGYEFERFFINSTLGLAGFINIADREFGTKEFDEDFGQTLGRYGLGQGFYINWPILGPSSVLETAGSAGDYFLEPIKYTDTDTRYRAAITGYKTINSTSLTLGDYETLKNSALDPYVAFRDAYIQHRKSQIKE